MSNAAHNVHFASDNRRMAADVAAALARGDFERANGLSRQGLLAGVEDPLFLNVAAFGLEREGRLDDSFKLLTRARQLYPGDALTLSSLGRWYSKVGQPEEALRHFDASLKANPGSAPAHHGRGLALAAMRDFEGALGSQELALELEPTNPAVLAALAGLYAAAGRFEDAHSKLDSALAAEPDNAAALVVAGSLALQADDATAAVEYARRALVQPALAGLHVAGAQHLLADALDRLGLFDEAFGSYQIANAVIRSVHHASYVADYEEGSVLAKRLATAFAGVKAGEWVAPSSKVDLKAADASGHVFLVGFPRSGTTLLEVVLASHPQIVTLEERPTLGDVGPDYFARDRLDRLFDLDEATAERLRTRYWAEVRGFGVELNGKLFVDKMPLNSLWLPYIAKVFPEAKILFARRDPRDVVLSAFRQRFVTRGLMYSLTDLKEAAHFYAAVMELAEVYRSFVASPWHDHRHEALIDQFENETRALCAFLEVSWSESLGDFAETARTRTIHTPSGPQVRRGLNRDGVGRWRGYESALQPILPILQPWVEKLGYA